MQKLVELRVILETIQKGVLPALLKEAREALKPFAGLGQWLFARDLPDDDPVCEFPGLNGYKITLTRGHFKAAHTAFTRLRSPGQEGGGALRKDARFPGPGSAAPNIWVIENRLEDALRLVAQLEAEEIKRAAEANARLAYETGLIAEESEPIKYWGRGK